MGVFFGTLGKIILSPKQFFENAALGHPISWGLIFYIEILAAEILIGVGIATTVLGQGPGPLFALFFKSPAILGITLLVAFLFIIISLFIGATVMHLFVLIFRGEGGFSGTFTVLVCGKAVQMLFFLAAPMLIISMRRPALPSLFIIASAGIYVLAVFAWIFIVQIIGYRAIHKMGTLRAMAALLMPVILFVLLGLSPARGYLPKVGEKIAALKNKTVRIAVKQESVKSDAPAPGSIEWRYDLAAALKEAGAKKTVVMADFYTDWCGWCKKLDNETYADKDVSELAKQFVCVKIDGDKNAPLVGKYSVRGYPTIIFLNPDGSESKRVGGYINSQDLLVLMKQITPQEAVAAPQPVTQEAQGVGADKFKLSGIVYTPSGYSALVNGAYVKTGDLIGNAKVVEVSKDSVRIMDADGKEVDLKL